MSTIIAVIIRVIITFVTYFSIFLAAYLPIMYIENRKLDKHISNKMSTIRESGAELDKSLDEVRAQLDRIDKSLDKIDKSLDKMDESMDRHVEFTRLMRDYSNYKIKRIEARENFCESQF